MTWLSSDRKDPEPDDVAVLLGPLLKRPGLSQGNSRFALGLDVTALLALVLTARLALDEPVARG